MSGRFRTMLSRRAFAAILLQGTAVWRARAAMRDPDDDADRGIGGTGVVPVDPGEILGPDRGIGGTGVIGTIRRFGSIVVNDLHVTFAPDVAVTVDGRPASARDLRLGQVVRVLARQRGDALVTRAIAAESEVVGPVDAIGPGHVVVLGQRVELPEGVAVAPHHVGDRLAVSGLRRLDGAVVASLVERRPSGPDRLRGPVRAGARGGLAVGGLAVTGLDPALLGRRVSLVGTRDGAAGKRAFHPSAVEVEPRVPFATADRVSLEAYVARMPDGLRLGSGLDVSAGAAALAEVGGARGVRAIVVARPDGSGRLDAQSLHVEAEPRARGSEGRAQGMPGAAGSPSPDSHTSPDSHASPTAPAAAGRDAGPRGGSGGAAAGSGGGSRGSAGGGHGGGR